MSNSQLYRVFKIKSNLAIQDPDMPSPRYHTAIFVETNVPGKGYGTKHHVTGDIVQGMHYESRPYDSSAEIESLHSTEFIGYTMAATHPSTWDNVLAGVPAPQRQKAFNLKTMKTEPVKFWDPLTFYDPGEPRQPLMKCTEWIEQLAIPALLTQGLIQRDASLSHST